MNVAKKFDYSTSMNPPSCSHYIPDLSPRPVNNTLPPDFPFRPSMFRIQFINTHFKIQITQSHKNISKKTFKKAGVHAAYPHLPENHSTHRIEMAKEEGANKLLTNCPSCISSFEKGLELMRESGEPMEFGIFDFYKVFRGLLVREVMGQRGT